MVTVVPQDFCEHKVVLGRSMPGFEWNVHACEDKNEKVVEEKGEEPTVEKKTTTISMPDDKVQYSLLKLKGKQSSINHQPLSTTAMTMTQLSGTTLIWTP